MFRTMRAPRTHSALRSTGALFLLLGLLAPSQTAQGAAPCDAPQTQLQMMECTDADYKTADAALNDTYREVMAKLNELDKTRPGWGLADALRESQRAWLPLRDRQCDWEAAFVKGGTMEPLIRLSCLSEMTAKRTDQLRETWKTYQ